MKGKHTRPLFPELTNVSEVKQQFEVCVRCGVCVLCSLGYFITQKIPVQPDQISEVTPGIMCALHTQLHAAVGLSGCLSLKVGVTVSCRGSDGWHSLPKQWSLGFNFQGSPALSI